MQALLLSAALLTACGMSPERLQQGKQIAFARDQGNCLACHAIDDGDSPGNIGPPLTAVAKRFRDKAQLREFIYDASRFNPDTSMPPFGKNHILSDEALDRLADYLWSLQ